MGEESDGVVGVAEVWVGGAGEGGGHAFGEVEGGEDVSAIDGFADHDD